MFKVVFGPRPANCAFGQHIADTFGKVVTPCFRDCPVRYFLLLQDGPCGGPCKRVRPPSVRIITRALCLWTLTT